MKRALSLIFAVIIALLPLVMLSSCSEDETGNQTLTLYVYNWGEYISDGSEDSLDSNAAFEDWYYETYNQRVTVNYSTFSSNEDMYAKISSGSVCYDIIVPSDYMIARMINEDMLRPINYDNLDNEENIRPEFMGPDAEYDYYDKGSVYSVPYMYGMVGIIYNTTMVDEEDVGKWDLMWNEKYKNNILQFNNSRDAFGTAQYALGISVNSDSVDDWRLALDKLKEQKKIVQGYVMDEIYNKMENGSAAIASYYAGDFLTMYENNEDLEFYYPEGTTNLYIDAMCIPKNSKHPEIAEKYIDFMLTEEPAVANAEYTYYASPNQVVLDSEEYVEYMNDIKENGYDLMYNTEGIQVEAYENLSAEKLQLINELWEELKSDISVSAGIYIICGVILAVLISVFTFLGIRKKYRDNY